MTKEELIRAENEAYNEYLEAARASHRARNNESMARLAFEKAVARLEAV